MHRNIILAGSTYAYRTGLNTHILALSQALTENNIDNTVVSLSGRPAQNSEYIKDIRFREGIGNIGNLGMTFLAERPTIVITYDDTWNLKNIVALQEKLNFTWIHYFLAETEHVGKTLTRVEQGKIESLDLEYILTKPDLIIPATELSRKAIHLWGNEDINVHSEVFLPLMNFDNRLTMSNNARRKIRSQIHIDDDMYMFFVIGRNFVRKNYAQLIRCFDKAWILENRPLNVSLYLHTEQTSPLGWDLKYLFKEFNTTNIFCAHESHRYLTDESISDLYCAMDCLISISHAEGICYPVAEAMYMGIPSIVGDAGYTPMFSNVSPNKITPTCSPYVPPGTNYVWRSYNDNDLVSTFRKAIHQRQERSKKLNKYILKYFNDEINRKKWIDLIHTISTEINLRGLI